MDLSVHKSDTSAIGWFPGYDYLSGLNKDSTESWMRMVGGGDGVIGEMTRFFRQSMEDAQELIQSLAAAKTPTEVFNCQLNFFNRAANLYMAEAETFVDLATAHPNGGDSAAAAKPSSTGLKKTRV